MIVLLGAIPGLADWSTEFPRARMDRVREQIASAIDLVVQQERMQDGSRRVVEIAEVQGMEGDVIVLEPLFRFAHKGFEGRRLVGQLEPLGVRPRLVAKLEQHGVALPPGLFERRPGV